MHFAALSPLKEAAEERWCICSVDREKQRRGKTAPVCRNVAPRIDKEGTHTNAWKEKEKKRRLVYFYGKLEEKKRKVKGCEDAYGAKPWMDGIFLADSAAASGTLLCTRI